MKTYDGTKFQETPGPSTFPLVLKPQQRESIHIPESLLANLKSIAAEYKWAALDLQFRLTRDRQCLNQRIEELRSKGLFPLPDRDYTTKYKWFRRMTNSEIGRRMLMRLLPMMEKER